MARRSYDAQTKAAAIAALMAGKSQEEVASSSQIPIGTIKSWWKRRDGAVSTVVVSTRRAEIGDLLVEYLRENLATLRAQSIAFRDPKWLERQSADAAAVLHGVMTDKAIRLLEAMSRAQAGPQPTAP